MNDLKYWKVISVYPQKNNRVVWHIREIEFEREAWVEMDADLSIPQSLAEIVRQMEGLGS